MDKHYYIIRKTENYSYELHFDIKYTKTGYIAAHMYVGDPKDPCLSISVPLKDGLKNNRYDQNDLSIAHLNKIKDMKECILSGYGESNKSFSKEMLYDVFHIIRANYSHIHHISLTDSSYIPCGVDDTLDLLYYAGVHGKTWYELNFNAYFVPRDKFIEYKCKLHEYSKKNKSIIG